jgi:hypothetical protein
MVIYESFFNRLYNTILLFRNGSIQKTAENRTMESVGRESMLNFFLFHPLIDNLAVNATM